LFLRLRYGTIYRKLQDLIQYGKGGLSYPVEMNIIGVDENQPRWVTFPVKKVKKADNSIFPIQEYDWNDIEARIEPLVNKVIEAVSK
jgi:hypothetical protein